MFITISILFFLITLWTCYREWKKMPHLIKDVYFNNHKDWLIAPVLVIFVFASVILLFYTEIEFLRWSIFDLFTTPGKGTNLVTSSLWSTGSIIISTIVYLIFVVILPYAAYMEEYIFRDWKLGKLERVKYSIIFGFVHMLIGVPVLTAIVLSVVGWFFSVRYIKALRVKRDFDEALLASTSLHTKYNLIVITFLFLFALFN